MYTSHGHHIDGTEMSSISPAPTRARCGGPGLCAQCSIETQYHRLKQEIQEIEAIPCLSVDQLIRVEALTIATHSITTDKPETSVNKAKVFEAYIRGES